jgi:DNA-binding transcriptional MerR regulator
MKMKELESRTGVNREAIRYYIREGLLPQPNKPKRNVAEYEDKHVERTLLIKRLQDEHFLPLKVVKEVIDKVARAPSLSQAALAQLLPELINDTGEQKPSTVAKLAKQSGLSKEELLSMASVGAIAISTQNKISARDVEIVKLWATAQRGYNNEFLAKFVDLARQWANFEAPHFLESFKDSSDDVATEEAAAALGARGIEIGGQLMSLMHTNETLRRISELTKDSA